MLCMDYSSTWRQYHDNVFGEINYIILIHILGYTCILYKSTMHCASQGLNEYLGFKKYKYMKGEATTDEADWDDDDSAATTPLTITLGRDTFVKIGFSRFWSVPVHVKLKQL